MRRRDFITLLGGAAAWPLAARAQQPLPVVGFLNSRSAGEAATDVDGFLRGLSATGYIDGQNVTIEYRWADNRYERLPALAKELVDRRVAVITATGGPISALAVKEATNTIPFVFITGVDPVKLGLVASLNRPGGNATGVNILVTAVESKRLGLLLELAPRADLIAIMVNPNSPELEAQLSDVTAAAQSIGKKLEVLKAGNVGEINDAFASIGRTGAQALLVCADPFFRSERARITALAARPGLAAVYEGRDYAQAGGLMSYGPNLVDMYRQVGTYTGQILKGAKPADLPVVQPTALALVINRRTAKALGLTIPPMLLARADEVIE
jgi:putative tryptophan/tyrosine transport system substrate-binding protein